MLFASSLVFDRFSVYENTGSRFVNRLVPID